MPKQRDPHADGRRTSNGIPPKQAKIQKERARSRTRKRTDKASKDCRAATNQLNQVTRELSHKEHLLAMMAEAPTIAAQRKILFSMFSDAGFNPVEELIEHAQDEDLPLKERVRLKEKLMEYYQPKPKSVDIQASVTGEMTIQVVSFADVTQGALKEADVVELPEDREYNEFLSPEELDLKEREHCGGAKLDPASVGEISTSED